jgi:hypothetical protein
MTLLALYLVLLFVGLFVWPPLLWAAPLLLAIILLRPVIQLLKLTIP